MIMAELDFPCLFYDAVVIETRVQRQRVKDESERFVAKLLLPNQVHSRNLHGETKENFENPPELHSVTQLLFQQNALVY
jgi:hypothetical protein